MRPFFLPVLLALLPLEATAAPAKPVFRNMVVIGWDGTQRDRMEGLLKAGKLPNLKKLIASGSYVATQVNEGRTETKPGWAQILTGYDTAAMQVIDNVVYQPIPKGWTLLERLRGKFGKDIRLLFLSGKDNNLAARGPHRVCVNCIHRYKDTNLKTFWWDEKRAGPPTGDGQPPRFRDRLGEPYFNAVNALDQYEISFNQGENELPVALQALEKNKDSRFFAFFHFEEPDEDSHLHGEGSPEYVAAILRADGYLGKIQEQLKKLGLQDKTIVIVTTDHGQDKNKVSHQHAPDTWLASSFKGLKKTGDRRDVAATILDLYGFDLNAIQPPLTGHSLLR